MSNLTAGELRRMLMLVPDNVPVLIECGDHEYRQLYAQGPRYGTALRDGRVFTEDIYVCDRDTGIGEDTEYGIRVEAFIIEG